MTRLGARGLALACLLLVTGEAQATKTQVFGGPGGLQFELTCAKNTYLVGFSAHAGAWVDGVGLLCAPYNAAKKKFGPAIKKGWIGGKGGMQQEVYCEPGDAITGISLLHTRGNDLKREYVMELGFICQYRGRDPDRCIATKHDCKKPLPEVYGFPSRVREWQFDRLFCPSSEYATGIQGRSAQYVNAIGLICAVLPATPPPAPKLVELNTDRPGSDYRDFDLSSGASHDACRDACVKDGSCLAYTYVKAGVQGANPRCWLKGSVPAARVSSCCVSGVMQRKSPITDAMTTDQRQAPAQPIPADKIFSSSPAGSKITDQAPMPQYKPCGDRMHRGADGECYPDLR